jgi:hypothetical protein
MALENVSLEEMESLAVLSKTLADNPATRKDFLKLIKTASPMTNIPEIDMETRFGESTRPLFDKIQNLENQLQEQNFKEMRNKAHGRLMEMGISKDEIPEIEKTMVEKKIGDYDTAAQFYLNQKQVAPPSAGTFATPMTIPTIKDMGGDMNAWARNEAFSAVNDIIKARK